MITIRIKPKFLCSPFPWDAALQAGGSLVGNVVGGIMGYKAQKEANKTNLQIASQNNQMSMDMFNRQLQYNSFENQRKMLEAAGYSPYSLFGTSSASAPSAPSLQQATVQPVDALAQSVGNATGNLAQIMSIFADAKLKNAQAQRQQIENDVLPELLEIQRQGGITDVVWKSLQNKLMKYQFDALAIQPDIQNQFTIGQTKLNAQQMALLAIQTALQQEYGGRLNEAEIEKKCADAFAAWQKGWLDEGELKHIDDKYKAILKTADAADKQANAAEKNAETNEFDAQTRRIDVENKGEMLNKQAHYYDELAYGESLLNQYKHDNYDRYYSLGLDKIEAEIENIMSGSEVNYKKVGEIRAEIRKKKAETQNAKDDHAYRLLNELEKGFDLYLKQVGTAGSLFKFGFGK